MTSDPDIAVRVQAALNNMLAAAGVRDGEPLARNVNRVLWHLWRERATGHVCDPAGCALALWFRRELAPLRVLVSEQTVIATGERDAGHTPRAFALLPECVRVAVKRIGMRQEPGLLEGAA